MEQFKVLGDYPDDFAPESFTDFLPEDIRTDGVFEGVKDLPSLAKAFVGAQKKFGMDPNSLVKLPTNDDDTEAYDAIAKALGWPEEANYELPETEIPFEDDMISGFKSVAHELRFTPSQTAGLFKWYTEQMDSMLDVADEKRTSRLDEYEAELKKQFGAAYDQRTKAVANAFDKLGGEELTKWLDETGFGSYPPLVAMMDNVAKLMQEDTGGDGDGDGGRDKFALTPDEAKQKINSLMADDKWMASYMDKNAADHQQKVSEMERLNKLAYPE